MTTLNPADAFKKRVKMPIIKKRVRKAIFLMNECNKIEILANRLRLECAS